MNYFRYDWDSDQSAIQKALSCDDKRLTYEERKKKFNAMIGGYAREKEHAIISSGIVNIGDDYHDELFDRANRKFQEKYHSEQLKKKHQDESIEYNQRKEKYIDEYLTRYFHPQ